MPEVLLPVNLYLPPTVLPATEQKDRVVSALILPTSFGYMEAPLTMCSKQLNMAWLKKACAVGKMISLPCSWRSCPVLSNRFKVPILPIQKNHKARSTQRAPHPQPQR